MENEDQTRRKIDGRTLTTKVTDPRIVEKFGRPYGERHTPEKEIEEELNFRDRETRMRRDLEMQNG